MLVSLSVFPAVSLSLCLSVDACLLLSVHVWLLACVVLSLLWLSRRVDAAVSALLSRLRAGKSSQ